MPHGREERANADARDTGVDQRAEVIQALQEVDICKNICKNIRKNMRKNIRNDIGWHVATQRGLMEAMPGALSQH